MSTKALHQLLKAAKEGRPATAEEWLYARLEVEGIEKAAKYAAYGRIPGVPEEQKHFMDIMLAIADDAKAREEA